MTAVEGTIDPPLVPGMIVDDYVIEEIFASNGPARTYRAHDPALDRKVALKLLPRRESADPRWVGHFRRGAQLLAAITHPNIIPVFGTGRFDDHEYVSMHYVP